MGDKGLSIISPPEFVAKPATLAEARKAGKGLTSLLAVLPQWMHLARLWFEGEERWKARGYAVLVLALSLSTTAFSVRVSYAERDLSTALSGKDVAGFYRAVGKFVVLIIIAAPFFALFNYVEQRLVLSWRSFLTRRLVAAYFSNRAYFLIKQKSGGDQEIDNPDQRICNDVGDFVKSSTTIIITLSTKLLNCIAFAGVLWGVEVPSLVIFLFAYAVIGTAITTGVFGRPLMVLTFRLLAREGDLRFGMIRVRENAEAIAFYKGENEERSEVVSRFMTVVATTRERIGWNALFDLWTNSYNYATVLVPSLLVAPKYFSGQVEFGVISQAVFAFRRIETALSVVINNLEALSGLAAETDRLDTLIAALRTASTSAHQSHLAHHATRLPAALIARSMSQRQASSSGAEPILQLEGLTVQIPGWSPHSPTSGSSGPLVQDLDLVLRPGEFLLVTGTSGCGKSSLLRAIAGLWVQGSGRVLLPMEQDVFYLPQRPYMPLGTLRQQLVFPTEVHSRSGSPPVSRTSSARQRGGTAQETQALMESGGMTSAEAAASGVDCSDATLLQLLEDVALPELVIKSGGLDSEADWGHVLSCGEQQRIGILRLLLHRPALAFLDEATSALDSATEVRLYALLRKKVSCYVSVGHRMQLLNYHTHVLECQGGGKWVKHTVGDFQRRQEAAGQM